MNVLFHVAVGVTIFSGVSKKGTNKGQTSISVYVSSFVIGILSHGILDYIPHCYPLNSKVDVILSLLSILFFIYIVNKQSKLLMMITLFGCVFPDIIDLSLGILNSILNINLPDFDNIFPWHFHDYSGSIYNNECIVSNVNHLLTLVFCIIIVFLNKNNFKKVLNKI